MQNPHVPTIQSASVVEPCQAEPTPDVGDTLRSADAQWLADLETLERIEQQALYQDPCFFAAMGEIVSRRAPG